MAAATPAQAGVRVGILFSSDRAYRGDYARGYGGYDERYTSRIGFDNGYRDGLRAGGNDDRHDRRFNFRDEGRYRDGDPGYRRDYGPRYAYIEGYRRGFEDGYRAGYRFETRREDNRRWDERHDRRYDLR